MDSHPHHHKSSGIAKPNTYNKPHLLLTPLTAAYFQLKIASRKNEKLSGNDRCHIWLMTLR
jgi:hypothetical protein